MVTNINSNLLHAAIGDEGRDGVAHRAQAGHRHACRHADHVRLRHAAIEEAVWALRFEIVEEPIADIAAQQHDTLVALREFGDLLCEGVSHVNNVSRRARSADLQSAVSRICNPPGVRIFDADEDGDSLPTASRRYGRLKIWA